MVPASRHVRRSLAFPILVAAILVGGSHRAIVHGEVTSQQLDAVVTGVGSMEIRGNNSSKSVPVVIIPEVHGVILVQLEEALVLQRLNSAAKISAIVLEGLLPDAAAQLSQPSDADPGQGIALLKDGTISAAEFMYLYKGTKLVPGETHATHDPNAESTDVCGLLGEYSATVLQERHDIGSRLAVSQFSLAVAGINATVEKLNSMSKNTDGSCDMMQTMAQLDRDVVTSSKAVASHVPEVSRFVGEFCGAENITDLPQIDGELRDLKSLRAMLSLKLPQDRVTQMDEYENFILARDQASSIMVQDLTKEVNDHASGVAVAIVGAAHLNRMIEKLNAANIKVAVLNLKSMGNISNGKLRTVSTNREFLMPVDSGPLGDALINTLSPSESKKWGDIRRFASCKIKQNRKEETVLTTAWFKGKSEFHAALDAVAKAAIGGGGGNEPPNHPPGTFSLSGMLPPDDGRWNKTNVHVLVKQGFIVYPDKEPKTPHVIVPVSFTDDNGKQVGDPIWAAISLASRGVRKGDTKDSEIESMLRDAIADEETGATEKTDAPEGGKADAKGDVGVPIRISMNTEAKLYRTKQAAMDSVGGAR